MAFEIDILRLSDDDLLDAFESKVEAVAITPNALIKEMYQRQIQLIRNEIKRRMK